MSEAERRDLEIIDKNAERLNREAGDVLDYQKLWRTGTNGDVVPCADSNEGTKESD